MATKGQTPPDTLVSRRERAFTAVHYREIQIGRVLGASAFLVYTYLDLKAGSNEAAWPSIRTIAKDTGLALSTIQRVIDSLIEHKLLTKEPGNHTKSNRYIILDPPASFGGVSESGTGEEGGVPKIGTGCTDDEYRGVPIVGTEEDTSKNSQEELLAQPQKAVQKSVKKIRQDRIKNALVDACGENPETSGEWGKIDKAYAIINKASQHLTDDQVVSEIYRRAKNYKRIRDYAELTANALANNWGKCKTGPPMTGPTYLDWTHGDPRGRV